MALIKIIYRHSKIADEPGTLYYVISQERKSRQISTGFRIFQSEWDEKRKMVKISPKRERKSITHSVREGIRRDMNRLNKIVDYLDKREQPYSADDVVDEFKGFEENYSLFGHMEKIIIRQKNKGNVRTSETYASALNSFRKFRQGKDLTLDCLTPEIMEEYEAWLKRRGVTLNTVSFYNRILRAAYNRAVEDGSICDRHPFRHVYTGVGKTCKRAIPLAAISQLKNLDLSSRPQWDFARDIFLMSFYLRGISFIDLAFLKKTDLKSGLLTYRRRKTNQLLKIKWTSEMQTILDKYARNPTDFLMPIITKNGANERAIYRAMFQRINFNLKKIAPLIGITIPLTLYVARHSWASAAKFIGIPVSIISEGMGHESESTTRIYLATLETTTVDAANSLIISRL